MREIDRTDTREERTERKGESDPLLSPLRNVPPLSWNRLEEGGREGLSLSVLSSLAIVSRHSLSLHSPLSPCSLAFSVALREWMTAGGKTVDDLKEEQEES